HELERDPGVVGRARPRRDDAAFEPHLEPLRHGRAGVAHGLDLGLQLAEVLHEVVGERVVVVEDEHPHDHSGCSQASAIALTAAFVFASDSSYWSSGGAPATVPPPACTGAIPSLTTTVRMWIAVSRSPP